MKYSSARTVLVLLIYAGWAIIVFGVVGSAVLYNGSGSLSVFILGIVASLSSGLVLIAQAQIGQALLDTADNSSQILSHIRNTNAKGNALGNNPAVSLLPQKAVQKSGHIKFYKGFDFIRTTDGVKVGDKTFSGVLAAEKWADLQAND